MTELNPDALTAIAAAFKTVRDVMDRSDLAEVDLDLIANACEAANEKLERLRSSALPLLPQEPEGWKLLPREPAAPMFGAGGVEQFKADLALLEPREAVKRIYQAMYDAAPVPPASVMK